MDGLMFVYFGINLFMVDVMLDDVMVWKWIGFMKVNGGWCFIVGNVLVY